MGLLVVFIVTVIIGQSLSIGVALAIDRLVSPYTGLVTFIALYFLMFWLGWKFSVRITEPNTRLGSWLQGLGNKRAD